MSREAATDECDPDRRVEDPFLHRLAGALEDHEGKIKTEDLWTIVGMAAGQRTQNHNERLGAAMRELGWEKKQRRFGGPAEYAYVKGDGKTLLTVVDYNDGKPVKVEASS